MEHGQLTIDRQQGNDHRLVHKVSGSSQPHGNRIHFLIAGKEFDNAVFAGEMNMVGRQNFIQHSPFGIANFRIGFRDRTANAAEYVKRTVFRQTVLALKHCPHAVFAQSRHQRLRGIVKVFQRIRTVGNGNDHVVGIAVNAVQRTLPGVGHLFQQRIVKSADNFIGRNPFAQGNDAAGYLQIGHVVDPGLSRLKHGNVFLFGGKGQIQAFDFKHPGKRTVVAADGHAV